MRKANIISAIVGLLISGTAFAYTFTFKKFKNVPVGPEFFPRALAAALFICCLILLITNIVACRAPAASKEKQEEKAPTLSLRDKDMQRAAIALLGIVVYALLWNILGFLIATPLALFGMIWLLGKRNYLMMALISVGATAVIFLVFKLLLGIEMPLGFLEGLF